MSELIDLSLRALLNPGDEVLVPSPDYPLWTAAVNLNTGRAVHYPCRVERRFIPDPQEIEALITPRTRAIVLVNPNNPTGAVYPRAVLRELCGSRRSIDWSYLSDEIYDQILYDDAEFVPMATLVQGTLCCTMSGLSKVYRACGYRVGWAVFSGDTENAGDYFERPRIAELIETLQQCAGAMGGPDRPRRAIRAFVSSPVAGDACTSRDRPSSQGVARSKYLRLAHPMGALYAFVEVRSDVLPEFDDQVFALDLLENKHVLVAPGVSFNVPYRNCFRVTNLPEPQVLGTVFTRIEELLDAHASGAPTLSLVRGSASLRPEHVPSRLIEAADAGRIVLAPSRELASALIDAVERAHRRAGRDIWPTPKILDFGTWLKAQHLERQLDGFIAAALSVRRRGAGALAPGRPEERGQRAVSRAFGRGACRAACAPRDVRIRDCAAGHPCYVTEESRALLSWTELYEGECRALHVVAPDELLGALDSSTRRDAGSRRHRLDRKSAVAPCRAALAHEKCGSAACSADTKPVERAACAADAPDGIARRGARGHRGVGACRHRRRFILSRLDQHPRSCRAARRGRGRLRCGARAAALCAGGAGGGRAVCGRGGHALDDYGPVRAALSCSSCAHGIVPFERFSALLRAPELSERRARRVLPRVSMALLRTRVPSEATLHGWLSVAERIARSRSLEPPAALARLADAARALEALTGSHRMSRWLAIWVAAFDRGPWSLRHRWSSGEFQAADRFRELLATLGRGDGSFGGLSRVPPRAFCERAAPGYRIPSTNRDPTVWVSGQWRIPGSPRAGSGWPAATRPIGRLRWIRYRWCRRRCNGSTA